MLLLEGAQTVDVLRGVAEHGVFWIPTLTPLWRALSSSAADAGAQLTASLRRVYEQHQASVARAFDLGVKIIAGTDAGSPGVPHGCLAEEVGLLVAAGASPADALKSATIWAIEALALGQETGLIAPGRRADFLLLRRNPLEEPTALREITHVACAGKLV